MKLHLKVVIPVAILLLALGWLVLLWSHDPFVAPPLPAPNGYDELVRAADLVVERTSDYRELDEAELADVVEQNKPAVTLAREALEKECAVPVDWSREPLTASHERALSGIRQLSRALSAQMRIELTQGNPSEAVVTGLIAFRLGNACAREGLIVDSLVGMVVRGIALDDLREVVTQDPSVRGQVLGGLVPILESAEPVDQVIEREIIYIRHLQTGFRGLLVRLQLKSLTEPATKSARSADRRHTVLQRLFVTHLALESFHETHGDWPRTLSELSPWLPIELVVDPYSKTSFVYRVTGGAYRLYSIGENGKDDGGNGNETGREPDLTYDLSKK